MPSSALKTLDVRNAAKWRSWLAKNHATVSEIWLVFHKKHTGKPTIDYEDAIDEALCYGWVDSLIRRLDDKRYARKFTPRKPESRWSTINRRRYARLKAAGRLEKPGLDRSPTERSGDFPSLPSAKVPAYISKAMKAYSTANSFFQSLTPRQRLQYIVWIDSARQQATKQRRLAVVIQRLTARQKPGVK